MSPLKVLCCKWIAREIEKGEMSLTGGIAAIRMAAYLCHEDPARLKHLVGAYRVSIRRARNAKWVDADE